MGSFQGGGGGKQTFAFAGEAAVSLVGLGGVKVLRHEDAASPPAHICGSFVGQGVTC